MGLRARRPATSLTLRVLRVVLSQQVFAVIVAVRRPHDHVDVLRIGERRVLGQVPQVRRVW